MKYYKKFAYFTIVFFVVLIVYVIVWFKVDDMTLSKGDVYEFNSGWIMQREQGNTIDIAELPFLGNSRPGETIIISNHIPQEYYGMTLSFLSADKMIKVRIDGEIVYEFGTHDLRSFGHTPGSVVNYVDIPVSLTEGLIEIEMQSSYADYAAKIGKISVGRRDVLILKMFKNNLVKILCSLLILICSLDFALLFVFQKVSKQNDGGMQYISGYCIVTSIYYLIETKVLNIFYGNQTMYSVLIFLSLMLIPLMLTLYYGCGSFSEYKWRWRILGGIECLNIVLQIVLQFFNLRDFMDMAVFSHALIMVSTVVVGVSYIQKLRSSHNRELLVEMLALFAMAAGGVADITRMYLVGVGDMGLFSRYGTTIFSVGLLYKHFRQIVMGYSNSIQENARLLKHEVEYMEKKNEQLRKANEEAEEARRNAMAANESKGRFLARMSHEIRTPINAVLGMDTMILRETKDMQIKEYALDIQNAGQNLLALINDILDFSKIESGKLEIIEVDYDLSSMIHDISNMVSAKAAAKSLELSIKVDETLPSRLLGDDVRIRQVLINLLNNAVKYTNEGRVSLSATGQVRDNMAYVHFAVEDTGIGIKEEDIHKLFEEFERIEEKRNRNIEGTGLGINIVAQLLALMNSKLEVESEYGKGSCFSFTIKQQIIDAQPVGNLEERIRQQSKEYSYMAAFTAPKAEVLVVDDNSTNQKVFVSLLKDTRVNIDVAGGGLACLEMVNNKHYDLIFLDHMMPDLDGVETLKQMKLMEDYPCKNTPVIALTANAISGAKEMYLAEGFDAFLSKPINPEKLEKLILEFLPREMLVFSSDENSYAEPESTAVKADAKKITDEEEMPEVDGIDWSYGLLHLPDKELLTETVMDFYKLIDKEADLLEEFYKGIRIQDNTLTQENFNATIDEEQLRQYRIKVHSMKSSANLIGAITLGGVARLLENAAKSGDMDVLDRMTPVFLNEWRGYKDKLKAFAPAHDKQKVDDYSVILAYLEMLRLAMEELDIDEMDKNMEVLAQYDYPPEIQKNMDQLEEMVVNMDSDGAVELIKTLMDQINKTEE